MSAPYILVVDDEPDIRTLVQEILQDEDYQVGTAENGAAARAALRDRRPDLILLDVWMPDVDGITLLNEWRDNGGLPCSVIVMSGHGNVETAVEATRLGAYDFLEKPLSMAKLLLTIQRALEADRLVRENVGLKGRSPQMPEPLGRSGVMQRLREQAKRVAQHNTWVLISGEPGTGREVLARYLHQHSPRRDRPFVDLAVSSIAPGNAAQELFGSEQEGRTHYGRLEQAAGGTLFLDEVADMDLDAQGQLVGALATRSFLRVGGTEPVEVDVRIVACTHKDLQAEVTAGRFREDLFYQLNVVPLQVPPLRDHREDVPELLSHFVDLFVAQEKLGYRHFNLGAQNFLRNYGWPGNIRELKNLVQRLLILGAGPEIDQDEVQVHVSSATHAAAEMQIPGLSMDQPLRQARESFERVYLEYQLEKHGGNVTRMATEVGMERTHLYRKLRAVGIEIREHR